MEVRSAEAFIAVAEELHFGRAAQRLHMAQPPVSRLIRNLESSLGVVLFQRSTHHVSLTRQGEALLEPARELVMLSRRMRDIARKSQDGEIGLVRLGFGEALVNTGVQDLARQVEEDRPGITLEFHSSQFSHHGLERILDGSLDLLIGRWDLVPASVERRIIAREEILIALPDNHRLADRESVEADELSEEPWVAVLPGRSSSLPDRLSALAADAGFVPRVVQISPDSSTLLVLVGAGVGVALTLSSVRDQIPARGVVFKPLRPAQKPMDVSLIWRHDQHDPALDAVLESAATVFPELA